MLVALAGAWLLLVAGCSSGGQAGPSSTQPPAKAAFDDLSPEVRAELKLVPGIASGLWGEPDEMGSLWTEPTIVYYRNGEVPDDDCGRAAPDPARWADNSYFCPANQHVLLDVDLLAAAAASNGPAAAAAIAMHELGHRANYLQNQVGTPEIDEENQADCDAGAQMAYAVHAGKISAVHAIIDGSLALYAGGKGSLPIWWDSEAHGLPGQRFDAFFTGYDAVLHQTGARATCWQQVGQAVPGPIAVVGPFAVALETGSRVDGTADNGVVTVSPPVGHHVTVRLWATADVVDATQSYTSWARKWFDSDVHYQVGDLLDTLHVTIQGQSYAVDLAKLMDRSTGYALAYQRDISGLTTGVFGVVSYPGQGTFEVHVRMPLQEFDADEAAGRTALEEALLYVLLGPKVSTSASPATT